MNIEVWAAVLDYWVSRGHDARFLDIPPHIAEQLENMQTEINFDAFAAALVGSYGGMDKLPPQVSGGLGVLQQRYPDTAMGQGSWYDLLAALQNGWSGQTQPTAPAAEQQPPNEPTAKNEPKWKRKAYFDGTECGYKDCSRKAEGYVSGTKPTKGGSQNAVWYGPACSSCCTKWHDSLRPMPIALLAQNRKGASDLANVLDIEVGDALKRLAEAGVDEKGQPVQQQNAAPMAPNVAITTTQQPGTWIAADPIQIPDQELAGGLAYVNGVLQQLANWHIMSQADMDYADDFMKKLKALWKASEEQRKELGRPWREKLELIQDYYKPYLNALKQGETVLKQRIVEGNARAEAARQAAYLAAQSAYQQGDMQSVAVATQQAVAADIAVPQGTSIRTVFVGEIVDLSQLPQEFWSWVPDLVKVQAAVDLGHRQIPGCRIYETNVVAARS